MYETFKLYATHYYPKAVLTFAVEHILLETSVLMYILHVNV